MRVRQVGIKFVPGAVAASYVSTDARTFREPESAWRPEERADPSTWFAGSGQSLMGDLIRAGVSGIAGHVSEPYLQSAVRPETLFAAYLAGFNLAESYYLALPHLSWQTVIVGDPLCRIGTRTPLAAEDLDPALNPDIEAPIWFAARQARHAAQTAGSGLPERAVTMVLLAGNLALQGNDAGARAALEQAIKAAPRMVEAHVRLAELYAKEGEFDAAIERYHATLALAPDHLLALNNLAYTLAVHRQAAAMALPLARKAAVLAPTDANVLDTLAWVEHLTGDNESASKRISEALRRNPAHAEINLHAAIIYQTVGARELARKALAEAVRLNPALGGREEVRLLERRLYADANTSSTRVVGTR
jgi:Tfp pilus assembly protein PilF